MLHAFAAAVCRAQRRADCAAPPGSWREPEQFFHGAADSSYTPLVGAVGEGDKGCWRIRRGMPLSGSCSNEGADSYDPQVAHNIHFSGEALSFLEIIFEQKPRLGGAPNSPIWTRGCSTPPPMDGPTITLEIAVEHRSSPRACATTRPRFAVRERQASGAPPVA